METVAPRSAYRHLRLRITTERPLQFIDLTDALTELVSDAGIRLGFVNVQSLHTTTAILINEYEPLLLDDFAALLERAAPQQARYRHDDATIRTVNLGPRERVNGHAHCRAAMLGAAAGLNVIDGALQLGRWQRVFFAEFDGPQERHISVLAVGESW